MIMCVCSACIGGDCLWGAEQLTVRTAHFTAILPLQISTDGPHLPCSYRCILAELDEPIFLRFYSPEWESGENFSNVLVVTLADYFQDLTTWLPAEYFKVGTFSALALSSDLICFHYVGLEQCACV